jgi:hypothetical protein
MDSPAARRQQSGSPSPIDQSQLPAIQQREQSGIMPLNPSLVSTDQAQAPVSQRQELIGDPPEVWLEGDIKNLSSEGIQSYL